MRNNKKRYQKIKFPWSKEEKVQEQPPKAVVLQINDSTLNSKSNYGGN